jgi:hypothetical protein
MRRMNEEAPKGWRWAGDGRRRAGDVPRRGRGKDWYGDEDRSGLHENVDRREQGTGKWGIGNMECGIGNMEWGIGNREWGMGRMHVIIAFSLPSPSISSIR